MAETGTWEAAPSRWGPGFVASVAMLVVNLVALGYELLAAAGRVFLNAAGNLVLVDLVQVVWVPRAVVAVVVFGVALLGIVLGRRRSASIWLAVASGLVVAWGVLLYGWVAPRLTDGTMQAGDLQVALLANTLGWAFLLASTITSWVAYNRQRA